MRRERPADASASNGRPSDGGTTLAVEIDGLVQRFGRLVPDVAALLDRIAVLRAEPAVALKVLLVRFGGDAHDAAPRDIDALGLGPTRDALRADIVTLPQAAALAALAGPRTLLLAGRERSAGEAIATGVPAYVVSDRRLADHRRLALGETERVIAEALRRPVPRPMSDAARTGMVLTLEAGSAQRVRARGRALLGLDNRADWLVLGPRQVFYTEIEQASDWLRREGAQLLARDVHLGALAIVPLAAQPAGELLVRGRTLGLGLFTGAGTRSWKSVRRSAIGTTDRDAATGTRATLPSLEQHHRLLRGLGDGTVADLPAALAFPGTSFDRDPVSCLAFPYDDDETETLIALAGPPAPAGAPYGAVAALAIALRHQGERSGLLMCSGAERSADTIERVLWEQERSRLRAIVQIRPLSGVGSAHVTRAATAGDRLLSMEAVLSEEEGAAAIAAAQILQEISQAELQA